MIYTIIDAIAVFILYAVVTMFIIGTLLALYALASLAWDVITYFMHRLRP